MNTLVIVLALLTQAGPEKGETRELQARFDGWIPAARDKAGLADFKRALYRKNYNAIRQGFASDALRFFESGEKATVEAIVEDEPTDPYFLPAALVRIHAEVLGPQTQDGDGSKADDRYYVPLAYLRKDGEKGEAKELPLPVFKVMADVSALPVAGHRMLLFRSGGGAVPFSPTRYQAAEAWRLARAGDKVGVEKMIAAGDLGSTANLTLALVIERHIGYGDDPNIAEVRFITGKHKDRKGFVVEMYTMIPVLQCLTEKQAQSQSSKRGVAGKAAAPSNAAATALTVAGNLERSKKKAAAKAAYERIVKDYPDSPEATTAAERIEAMDGR